MSRVEVIVPKNEGVQRSPPRIVRPVIFAAGDTYSESVDVRGDTLVGIVIPPTWTAADISFEVSFDDGNTWHAVYTQAGVRVKITGIIPGALHVVPAASLMSIARLRLVSSVAQVNPVLLSLILLS